MVLKISILLILFSLFHLISSACCNNCQFVDSENNICLVCSPGYKLYENKTCIDACPFGFSESQSFCTSFSPTVLNIDFSSYTSWIAKTIGNLKTTNDQPLNSSPTLSPIPTKQQGFFFNSTQSSLVTIENSVIAPDFILSLWCYVIDNGEVVHFINTVDQDFSLFLDYYYNNPDITFANLNAYAYVEHQWNLLEIRCETVSGSLNQVFFYANGQLQSSDSDSESQINFGASLKVYIGSGLLNWDSARMFVYKVYLTNSRISFDMGAATDNLCVYNQFWQENQCVDCDPACSDWPWCFSPSCELCGFSECTNCTGFSPYDGCIGCANSTCQSCSDATTQRCTVCNNNLDLYEDGSCNCASGFLLFEECTPCMNSSCLTCDKYITDLCSACKSGFELRPDGTCGCKGVVVGEDCIVCKNSTCKKCDDEYTDFCSACFGNLQLDVDGMCNCETGALVEGYCETCANSTCRTCDNNETMICTSCVNNLEVDTDGICGCKSGALSENECLLCVNSTCQTCDNVTQLCLSCANSLDFYVDGTCNCKTGALIENECVQCANSTCLTCSNGTTSLCTSCFEGFDVSLDGVCNCAFGTLVDGECASCANSTCKTCENDTTLNCTSCVSDVEIAAGGLCFLCKRWLQPSDIQGYFTENFSKIVVEIKISIRPVDCEDIFDENTLGMFGDGFNCSLSSDFSQVLINLGKDYTVSAVLSFVNEKLYGTEAVCGFNQVELATSLSFDGVLPEPRVVVLGPTSLLFECYSLFIDGELSSGGALGRVEYKWDVDSSVPGFSSYSLPYGSSKILAIDSSKLSEGTLAVTLTGKNNFGIEKSKTISVDCLTRNKLAIEFDSSIEYSCFYSETCLFSVQNILSCDFSTGFSVKWELLNDDLLMDESEIDKFWSMQKSENSVMIPSRFFPITALEFKITAENQKKGLFGLAVLKIDIMPEPPLAILDKASGSVSEINDLILNSSLSYDPTGFYNVSFKWNCVYLGSQCDFSYGNNGKVIIIPKEINHNHKFSYIDLTVTTDFSSKSSQNSAKLKSKTYFYPEFTNKIVPGVNIREYYAKTQPLIVKHSTPFVLEAVIKEDSAFYSMEWVFDKAEAIVTGINQRLVRIDSSALEKGQKYTINLKLTKNNEKTFNFYYKFAVNSSPILGSFEVTPLVGIETKTEFTFKAKNWIDSEEDYPLSYTFGYKSNDNDVFLTLLSTSPFFITNLPYINTTINLFIRVYDSLEDFSVMPVFISLSSDINFSPKDYFDNQTEALSRSFDAQLLPKLINFAETTLNREFYINGKFKDPSNLEFIILKNAFNVADNYLKRLLRIIVPSPIAIDQIISLLDIMTKNPSLRQNENFDKIISAFNKLLKVCSKSGLTPSQAKKSLLLIKNSLEINSETIYRNTKDMIIISELLETISKGLSKNLVIGETKDIETENISLKIVGVALEESTRFNISLSSRASVQFPEYFLSEINGPKNLAFSLVYIKPVINSSDSNPTLVAASIFSLEDNTAIPVKLQNFIKIEIPLYNSNFITAPGCFFLKNSNSWSNEGCHIGNIYNNSVECLCDHLSLFSSGDKNEYVVVKTEKFYYTRNIIEIFFLIILLSTFLPLSIILYEKDKSDLQNLVFNMINEDENKKSHETLESGRVFASKNKKGFEILNEEEEKAEKEEKVEKKENKDEKNIEKIPLNLHGEKEMFCTEIFKEHLIFNAFLKFDPLMRKTSKIALAYLTFYLELFLVAVFINTEIYKSFDGFLKNYKLTELLIAVISVIVSTIFASLIEFLIKIQPIGAVTNISEKLAILQKNKIKFNLTLILILIAISFVLLGNIMFCLNFYNNQAHKWLIISIICILVDLIAKPLSKAIFINLLLCWLLSIRKNRCNYARKNRIT